MNNLFYRPTKTARKKSNHKIAQGQLLATLAFLFVGHCCPVFSQTNPGGREAPDGSAEPSGDFRIGPGPNSTSTAKFAEIPVDKYTGVPNIEIPLFTVTGKKLSFPTSIRYHGAGVKVNEIAGMVGLSWDLQAGASISRVMRGHPDEEAEDGYFARAASIPSGFNAFPPEVLKSLTNNEFDMMPDVFYYDILGASGKFMFDNNGAIRTIPQADIQITPSDLTDLNTFTIVADDGTIYQFENVEEISITGNASQPGGMRYNSTWHLTRIISSDKTDTITITYQVVNGNSWDEERHTFVRAIYLPPPTYPVPPTDFIEQRRTVNQINVCLVKSIESSYNKIDFFYGSRTDYAEERKLNSMIFSVKDPLTADWVEQKSMEFSYGYFSNRGGGQRLRLDAVQEKELTGGTVIPATKFYYNLEDMDAPGSNSQDHWGYFNGEANSNLAPEHIYAGSVVKYTAGNSREPNAGSIDAFMLQKIVNPLGGSTEYMFQINKYNDGTLIEKPGPGLRIARIVKKDPFSEIESVTNYHYAGGVLFNVPEYVKERDGRQWTSEMEPPRTFRVVDVHASPTNLGSFAATPLVYGEVTEYYNDDVNAAGKIVSTYNTTGQDAAAGNIPFTSNEESAWAAGRLMTETVYKVENGVETPVSRIINTYQKSDQQTSIRTYRGGENIVLVGGGTALQSGDFGGFPQTIYSIFQYLSATQEYVFKQNSTDNTVKTTNYFYERTGTHLQLTKRTATTSESGVTRSQQFTYPADYTSGSLLALKNLHIYNVPVEVVSAELRGATEYITGYQKTDFQQLSADKIYPQFGYRPKFSSYLTAGTFNANRSSYLKQSVSFNKYNESGMLIESQAPGGQPQSRIIDKAVGGVAAEVSNAQADQIAYSSFESLDNGNWDIHQDSEPRSRESLFDRQDALTLDIDFTQTTSFTYTVDRSGGGPPMIFFSCPGKQTIERVLSSSSGNGSFVLEQGSWTVWMEYEDNVHAVQFRLNSQYLYTYPVSYSPVAKTGAYSVDIKSSLNFSKSNLPAGDYRVSFYRKSNAAAASVSGGGQVIHTEVTADVDGWQLVQTDIHITSGSDKITVTGNGGQLDELRLQPVNSFMATTNYDKFRRVITVTDNNLRSAYSEYDPWGRTTLKRDHFRNIVQSFEYQFAGQ
jgi:hypothetical protein